MCDWMDLGILKVCQNSEGQALGKNVDLQQN